MRRVHHYSKTERRIRRRRTAIVSSEGICARKRIGNDVLWELEGERCRDGGAMPDPVPVRVTTCSRHVYARKPLETNFELT